MKKPPYLGTIATGFRSFRYNFGATNTFYDQNTVIETGSITSVRTLGFKTIPKRELPFHPFSYFYSKELFSEGSHSSLDGRLQENGYVLGMITLHYHERLLTADEDDADIRARITLLKQMSNMSINLAQTFAERKQTVDMLTKTVNRLASAVRAIRSGKLNHAQQILKRRERPNNGSKLADRDFGYRNNQRSEWERKHEFKVWKDVNPSPNNLSNHWLEYSYGWRPLLNDIFGACELLADTFYRKRPTVFRSTGKNTKQKLGYMVASTQISNPEGYSKEVAYSSAKTEVRYVVEVIEDDAHLMMMSSTGLHQPFLLAWELIPYSFVVDWIFPVGQYIKNMSATRGLLFKRGTRTVVSSDTHSTMWQNVSMRNDTIQRPVGLQRQITRESKVRTVLTGFPSPPLPMPRMPNQGTQLLSALALITQAFKR